MPELNGPAISSENPCVPRHRQKGVRPGVVQQRITPGEHIGIERAGAREPLARADLVHADADGSDLAGAFQFLERADGAGHGDVELPVIVVALMRHVDVVDKGDVDPAHPQTMIAGLDRAHRAVVGIIMLDPEPHRPAPDHIYRLARGHQQPSHLGRQGKTLARPVSQDMAEPVFGLSVAVLRGGVEMADACVMGRLDSRQRAVLGDMLEQVAERRTPEAEHAHLHVGLADAASGQGV